MVRRSIRCSITRIDCATVLTVSCTCHSTPPSELSSASTAANSLIPRTCMRICGRDEKSVRSSRPDLTNRGAARCLVEKLNAERLYTTVSVSPYFIFPFSLSLSLSLFLILSSSLLPLPPILFFCLYVYTSNWSKCSFFVVVVVSMEI